MTTGYRCKLTPNLFTHNHGAECARCGADLAPSQFVRVYLGDIYCNAACAKVGPTLYAAMKWSTYAPSERDGAK